jgi:hypothetical protein
MDNNKNKKSGTIRKINRKRFNTTANKCHSLCPFGHLSELLKDSNTENYISPFLCMAVKLYDVMQDEGA